MRKLFIAALIIGATFSLGLAQETSEPQPPMETEQMLKMGHAPGQPGGIGRAVVVVTDELARTAIGLLYDTIRFSAMRIEFASSLHEARTLIEQRLGDQLALSDQ